jgi:hypothetical protein
MPGSTAGKMPATTPEALLWLMAIVWALTVVFHGILRE